MHIIYLEPLEPQVYNDQASENITEPPKGAAYIPEDFPLPPNFPRLSHLEAEELPYTYEVEVEKMNLETGKMEPVTEQRTKMMMTVTVMEETTLPIPEPTVDTEPTAEERIAELEAELETTNTQLINTQLALCDLYESNLALQEMIQGGV